MFKKYKISIYIYVKKNKLGEKIKDCFLGFPKKREVLNTRNKKEYMKSSDVKASKCHLKFSSLMMIFIKLVYLS